MLPPRQAQWKTLHLILQKPILPVPDNPAPGKKYFKLKNLYEIEYEIINNIKNLNKFQESFMFPVG